MIVDGIIRDIMNKPIGIESIKKIKDAIEKILSNKIGRVFIFESKNPVGILSEKDILSFLFNDKLHRSVSKVSVDEIMKKIFFIDGNITMSKAAQFMIDNKCSSVAVGSSDDFEGIVTKTDLTKYYAENEKGKYKVADWMSVHYFSVYETDSLYDVMKTMLGFGISRIMIIDHNRLPVGILSTGDLLKAIFKIESQTETQNSHSKYQNKEFWSNYDYFCSQPAGKIMSRNIIKIKLNEMLSDACQIMLDNNINAVGVEDSTGKLAGIIGKRDVLLALASIN